MSEGQMVRPVSLKSRRVERLVERISSRNDNHVRRETGYRRSRYRPKRPLPALAPFEISGHAAAGKTSETRPKNKINNNILLITKILVSYLFTFIIPYNRAASLGRQVAGGSLGPPLWAKPSPVENELAEAMYEKI